MPGAQRAGRLSLINVSDGCERLGFFHAIECLHFNIFRAESLTIGDRLGDNQSRPALQQVIGNESMALVQAGCGNSVL